MHRLNLRNFFKTLVYLVFVIISLARNDTVLASYSDNETSLNSSLKLATLDFSIRDTDDESLGNPIFDSTQISPSIPVISKIKVVKIGGLDFKYKVQLLNISGSDSLCNSLDLELSIDGSIEYSGKFVDLKNQQFTVSDLEDTLDFKTSVPDDASLQNKNCNFDIKLNSWQADLNEGEGFSDTEQSNTNSIYTLGWEPYVLAINPGALSGERYEIGSDIVVNWEATSTGNLPDNSLLIQLSYSEDGGANFVEFAFLPFNNGSYIWSTPTTLISDQMLIKISASNSDPGGPFLMSAESLQFSLAPKYVLRDIIINEVYWSGSTNSTEDQWVELYNNSSNIVNLTGWTLNGAGEGDTSVTLSGTLGVGEYLLLSKYVTTNSAISDSISSNLVEPLLNLDTSGELLQLYDLHNDLIDTTPSGNWAAGENTVQKRSMERNSVPGDGSDPVNWHSCIDAVCNDSTYWDTDDGEDYGTPKSLNHSSNDTFVTEVIEAIPLKTDDVENITTIENEPEEGLSTDSIAPEPVPEPEENKMDSSDEEDILPQQSSKAEAEITIEEPAEIFGKPIDNKEKPVDAEVAVAKDTEEVLTNTADKKEDVVEQKVIVEKVSEKTEVPDSKDPEGPKNVKIEDIAHEEI